MAKVNISLPDPLLERIDTIAGEKGLSRSGLVREASAEYLDRLAEEREAVERQDRIQRAIEDMRRVAARVPADFDGTAFIRGDRDEGHGSGG